MTSIGTAASPAHDLAEPGDDIAREHAVPLHVVVPVAAVVRRLA